jgi:hypothetical protein
VIVVIDISPQVFFQVNSFLKTMLRALTLLFTFYSSSIFAISDIQISVQHIEHEKMQISDLKLHVDLTQSVNVSPSVKLNTKFKPVQDDLWIAANLLCDIPKQITKDTWHCTQGLLHSDRIHVPYTLDLTPTTLGANAMLNLQGASFSDAVGLHAAEKLTGNLQLLLEKEGDFYRWKNNLNWTGGEMFWQPFFLKGGGHQFISSGKLVDDHLKVEEATLEVNQVGKLHLKGEMQLQNQQITQLDANLPDLDLATAYPLFFKPFLEKSAFNHAQMAGKVALKAKIVDAELKALSIQLNDVDIEDNNKKFAFYKLNATIPWDYDNAHQVSLSYLNGHLLNLPLGKTALEATVNRYAWTAPNITLPILDGALNLSNISAARIGSNWYWHLGAAITPINMADFSLALKLPIMEGRASGEIPQVTYNSGILSTNGEVRFNVFDGQATITNLTLTKPLSNQPVLNADMNLRHLDLGKLTKTFSFGSIEGKLDGDVNQLVMQNWKPVSFDASVQSSAGKYPKKISQRAVENISALGGAGAAAAVQRSVLRFFEEFNYESMRLSCKLANNICQMNGLESTGGGYIIVKGSGIPAITVMGFNRNVGWHDLLGRIKRITDENTQAIVK